MPAFSDTAIFTNLSKMSTVDALGRGFCFSAQ